MNVRKIEVKALTRVEGEGGLYVRMRDGTVDDIRLTIYEPPRLFEKLLEGRQLEDTPDIVARICGICPVAYQMSSVHALEAALGVTISHEIRRLRRLLYCGEWIESHTLHVFLLNIPDFLGYDSGLEMAAEFPDEVNRGLRLKKHANQMLEILGGRAIHPVNVAVGGFYRAPPSDALRKLIPDLEWCVDAAIETTRWVTTFDYPDFEQEYQFVSVSHPEEYPMNEGNLVTSDSESIRIEDFDDEFEERHVEHSTALHAVRKKSGSSYFLGPLARVNLNRDRLSPTARRLADEIGIWPCSNPYKNIIARCLEITHAFEEALMIIRDYEEFSPPRISYDYAAGSGASATEAPRGMLYHKYAINEEGKIESAVIIPPTSQNQAQIESDLRQWVPRVIGEKDPVVARTCENLVRCYDPCISCSTHFLQLDLDRG